MDLDEYVSIESLQEVLKRTPKVWTKLQNHIKSFENVQECIDFFNNLEGIDTDLNPNMGDVLLQE